MVIQIAKSQEDINDMISILKIKGENRVLLFKALCLNGMVTKEQIDKLFAEPKRKDSFIMFLAMNEVIISKGKNYHLKQSFIKLNKEKFEPINNGK